MRCYYYAKKFKKKEILCSVVLIFSLISTFNIQSLAVGNNNDIEDTVVLSREYSYYDFDINANVIAFTLDEDNGINYLSESEVYQLSNNLDTVDDTDFVDLDLIESSDKPTTRDYREWYEFVPYGPPTKSIGPVKKVSADFVAGNGGGSITKNFTVTSSESFSVNVSSSIKKSAIQAGCGFTWISTASASTSYTVNLLPGESGYMSFQPYYNKVQGDLKLYSNWDGYITSEYANGLSVMKTDDGEPDGLYKFIYY